MSTINHINLYSSISLASLLISPRHTSQSQPARQGRSSHEGPKADSKPQQPEKVMPDGNAGMEVSEKIDDTRGFAEHGVGEAMRLVEGLGFGRKGKWNDRV